MSFLSGILGFLVCLFIASIIEVVRTRVQLRDEEKARLIAEDNLKRSQAMVDNLADLKGAIRREVEKTAPAPLPTRTPAPDAPFSANHPRPKPCPSCGGRDVVIDVFWPHCANCSLGTKYVDWDLAPNILQLRKRSEVEQISLWNSSVKNTKVL